MKTNLLSLLSFICMSLTTTAQAPEWIWTKSSGGAGYEAGSDITTDAAGNIYATGVFGSPSISFGTITLTNSSQNGNMFIVKYNPSGNVLWAKCAGGSFGERSHGIVADANGNVFITGTFLSPTLVLGTTTLTNSSATGSSSDGFVAKYDASGNVLWAKSAAGTDNDASYNISTDSNGNVFIAGEFASPSLIFGTTTLTAPTSTQVSSSIFVAKYDPSGNLLWAKSAGGANASDHVGGISADVAGNVLVTGSFADAAFTLGSTTFSNTGNFDFFIVKYDALGNALWAQTAVISNNNFLPNSRNAIATDAAGNTIITGSFGSASVVFGTTTLTNAATTGSTRDVFVVKYSPAGNVLWATSAGAGGTASEQGMAVCTDAVGNAYILGQFTGTTLTLGATTLTNSVSNFNNFVSKYDASGNVLWAKALATSGSPRGFGICNNSGGNLFITGSYDDSSPLVCGTTTLTNAGFNDFFVATLGESSVGISENIKRFTGTAFPNPVKNKLYFELEDNSPAKISIINSIGQTVLLESNFVPSQSIDLGSLPNGIYFVRLERSGSGNIIKVIKE